MSDNVLAIFASVLISFVASSGFWAFMSGRTNKKSATTRLLMGIAYTKAFELGMHYIQRGDISRDELEDLSRYLYVPYKELGGNGVLERLMQEVMKLPLTQDLRHSEDGHMYEDSDGQHVLDLPEFEQVPYTPPPVKGHLLSSSVYDKLKMGVELLLPGVAALYYSIAKIWGLGFSEEITGTAAAIALFLGILLKVATASYNNSDTKYDGDVVVTRNYDGQITASLEANIPPDQLLDKKEILFKVK